MKQRFPPLTVDISLSPQEKDFIADVAPILFAAMEKSKEESCKKPRKISWLEKMGPAWKDLIHKAKSSKDGNLSFDLDEGYIIYDAIFYIMVAIDQKKERLSKTSREFIHWDNQYIILQSIFEKIVDSEGYQAGLPQNLSSKGEFDPNKKPLTLEEMDAILYRGSSKETPKAAVRRQQKFRELR